MSVVILEALENADYNLQKSYTKMLVDIAKEQLHNAVVLLQKGYSLYDEIEPLLEQYGDVEKIPVKEAKK